MADMKFGPEWLRALSDGNSVTSPPPSPGLVMPKYKLAEHRYGREEMLVLFTPSEKIPETLQEFPSIVSEKLLQPMSYISPSEEEQRLLSSSVNSTAVLRMMGGGGRGSAPPLRGRGVAVGPDRGRGRGRGRGDGGFYRDFDEDGFRSVRHGRGPSWGEEGRGFASRGGFDEPLTSPRREFSRSMSSENWRDAKRGPGTENREEQEDGEGDWRRAGPRDRWNRNWREPHERGFDREFAERGRYYEDYDRQRGFERPRTYSRSKSYDEEGDLPEWSTADADDIECLGTFDSSGAFMSMKDAVGLEDDFIDVDSDGRYYEKEDEREESPRSEKSGESRRKDTPPRDVDNRNKIKERNERPSPESEEGGNTRAAQRKDTKKSGKQEANEAKTTEDPQINGETAPTSAKFKTSSVNSRASGKNKLQEERNVSSVKNPVEKRGDAPRSDSPKAVSPAPRPLAEEREMVENKVGAEVDMLAEQTAATVIDHEKRHDTVVHGRSGKMGRGPEPDDFDHLEKAAEDLMATWTAEEDEKCNRQAAVESGGVPMNHEDAKRWFYKDPQGDLQGPFSSTEMAEWFSAGYFTMNLLVKRGCDDIFHPLGELIKRWGRVPFLNGPTPPPMKSTASTPTGASGIPGAGVMPAVPANTNAMPAAPMNVTPPVQGGPADQALQQQFLMQQQQALYRQLQMHQLMQVLQQQEGFAKLSPTQQQQLCMQLFLKHQQHHMMQQQQAAVAAAAAAGNPGISQQPNAGAPQNLSPRSASVEPQVPGPGQPVVSMANQNPANQGFQRSISQPGGEAPSNWSNDTSPATSGNWNAQPTSVWDIDQPKSQAQSFEDIQRMEIERQRRQRDAEEHELQRRKEEEIMKQREDEIRRREEEERIKTEIERQKEMRRQEQMRLQREQEEMLRRRQEEETRRRQEEEDARRREEDDRRRQEQDRRRQEEEMRRRQEEEIRRQQELQRQAEEERKMRELEELERKRMDEIRRRQEKAEELKRQQTEALRRMQQEQMADMQLPSHAQWANSSGANQMNNGPTLAEIQKLEAENAERERMEDENQKLMDMQRQHLAAIQQQQQQQRSWSAQKGMVSPQAGAPSLLEIQEEQARQLEEKQRQHQHQAQQQQQQKAKMPLGAAAAWGSVSSANWAQEGAWGNMQKQTGGFWDDAVGATGKPKQSQNNNAGFPQLNVGVGGAAAAPVPKPAKTKNTRNIKDQETVQRLFQETKPKDEFTQWCENFLKGVQANIDVPTFIGFLQDVESPYEVHDYVRVYLGESKEAIEFAKQFIERRSRFKNKLKQDQREELMWGPAPAVNPQAKQGPKSQAHHNNNGMESEASKNKQQKKKGKLQKIDASTLLGFTVHAAERVNIGEIDSVDA